MNTALIQTLERLNRGGLLPLLSKGLKGLEKESLRITHSGHIAQTQHPAALGSALLHPNITTDYSESLIELITGAHVKASDTLNELHQIHAHVHEHLQDEWLLASSMPCLIRNEADIPIARYGSSNIGQMKTIYRRGLAWRYGRAMQSIAGLHFNYSVAEPLWPALQAQAGDTGPLQHYINVRYFGMVRNTLRYGWLIPYLFGHSPAFSKSFFTRTPEHAGRFTEFYDQTLFLPHATSLRMSDIGYRNDSQSLLDISVNSLDAYVADLGAAINTPWPEYEKIGIKQQGVYQQLNTHILQIENEYYSSVRPKQIAHSGEKPTHALKQRGVRYLELRCVDLNLFEPAGVALEQLYFLEVFLLLSLLLESPDIHQEEKQYANRNAMTVACCGRAPGLLLQNGTQQVALTVWARELLDAMQVLAEAMDSSLPQPVYAACVRDQIERIETPDQLPSARMLALMRSEHSTFIEQALQYSAQHAQTYRNLPKDAAFQQHLAEISARSHEDQRTLETTEDLPFDLFLARYFNRRSP